VFTPTWRRCNDSDTMAVIATEAYATLARLLQKGAQLCAPRCPHHLALLSPRHAAHRLHTRASLPCPTVIFACERVRAVRGHRCQPSSRTARVRRVPPLAAAWRPSPCAPRTHRMHILTPACCVLVQVAAVAPPTLTADAAAEAADAAAAVAATVPPPSYPPSSPPPSPPPSPGPITQRVAGTSAFV
jgi:hypothetical protein